MLHVVLPALKKEGPSLTEEWETLPGGQARNVTSPNLARLMLRLLTQIPSYFALILRAFSVIEGIALRVDPGYSIVQECFPYIARRLLTDNHPRTRAALQQLLYAVRPATIRRHL